MFLLNYFQQKHYYTENNSVSLHCQSKQERQERQNKNGATYISHLPLIRWQIYEPDF